MYAADAGVATCRDDVIQQWAVHAVLLLTQLYLPRYRGTCSYI